MSTIGNQSKKQTAYRKGRSPDGKYLHTQLELAFQAAFTAAAFGVALVAADVPLATVDAETLDQNVMIAHAAAWNAATRNRRLPMSTQC